MTELVCYRGLPGSGKSTHALQWVSEKTNRVGISRDGLRRELYPADVIGEDYYSSPSFRDRENRITEVQHERISGLLGLGFSVAVHDTNLVVRRCRELMRIAEEAGAEFEVADFSDVPLEECIRRQAGRPEDEQVPRSVIRRMYEQYVAGGLAPLPTTSGLSAKVYEFPKYTPNPNLPIAVCVDTDGTLANHGERNPYDTSKYEEDTAYENVAEVVRRLQEAGITIIGVSGRSDEFYDVTLDWWIDKAGIDPDEFYMRKEGDTRNDAIIKSELFDTHIANRYNVIGVFDDRIRVLRMWEQKGLTTFRVGGVDGGDF